MFTKTAINFNDYFWMPCSFFILLLVGLLESFLAYKFLSHKSSQKLVKRITLTCLVANVASFFSEYYLSVFLNSGNRILVWVPWVKIIGPSQFPLYLVSFLIVFLFTFLSEFIIYFVFLKSKFKGLVILKTTFKVNLITTIILIIIFNCILFNVINGQAEGFFDDILPAIPPISH